MCPRSRAAIVLFASLLDERQRRLFAGLESLRRGCADGRVTPVPSLLLAHAMSEARTISDPAANAKLSKGTEGHRRHRARDDAAAAAILAVAAGLRRARRPASSGGVLFSAG